jgi:hypothetical protein
MERFINRYVNKMADKIGVNYLNTMCQWRKEEKLYLGN